MPENSRIDGGDQRSMLVTGATGFIGARLATLALERGYAVRTLTRNDWAATPWVPVRNRFFGSLPAAIPAAALEGADVVVHCAADIASTRLQAQAVNIEGTRRLATMAQAAGVKTFIFISSQSARADAEAAYGQTKYAAEQVVRSLAGLRTIVLRPGLVTGPGGRGLYGRMVNMVKTLPALPLLDGGRALVQPIHVDDLCDAILQADARADELGDATLNLGDVEGCTLAQLLDLIAATHTASGHKRYLNVPLAPVMAAVGIAERLGMPLPITGNNLRGMRRVDRMETAESHARLGLTLRPLAAMVAPATESTSPMPGLDRRPVRVILVGTGRVGLVHAVTLTRLPGVTLAALVDRAPAATGLLHGMGVSAPSFTDLDEAIAATQPDAAIIATPPSTHLALTTRCLEHGLAVMVEKPLAVRGQQLREMADLAARFPDCPIQVGYVMPRNPQIAACVERLRAGEYGRVLGFTGVTLISLIQAPAQKRWEVQPDISGGGALINAGGHVLSMIRAAFGDPETLSAEQVRIYSEHVEDSLVVQFQYPDFQGVHYCSWSIDGFPRQENILIVRTERGTLTLTGSVGAFVAHDGETSVTHQLDFDIPFNLAPDYAGAGFATELLDLAETARSRQPAPMSLENAASIERLLFDIYRQARLVLGFSMHHREHAEPTTATPFVARRSGTQQEGTTVRRLLDLRDLPDVEARGFLASASRTATWDGFLLTAAQCAAQDADWLARARPQVTTPNFLHDSRMLSNGRYLDVLRGMGVRGFLRAGLASAPVVAAQRKLTFWVAALALLAADLEKLPASFGGTILLHPYLTDFALALRQLGMLERMLQICHRIRPSARVGLHTNMAADTLNALHLLPPRVDEVSVLAAPGARGLPDLIAGLRTAGPGPSRTITVEVGLAPPYVHRAARTSPHAWAAGADAIVLGAHADADVAHDRIQERQRAWSQAFPGLAMPEGMQ